jgi:hypothetical protein
MFDTLNLARWQSADVAKIEEDHALLEQGLKEEHRIAETAVDEAGMEKRAHCTSPALESSGTRARRPIGRMRLIDKNTRQGKESSRVLYETSDISDVS